MKFVIKRESVDWKVLSCAAFIAVALHAGALLFLHTVPLPRHASTIGCYPFSSCAKRERRGLTEEREKQLATLFIQMERQRLILLTTEESSSKSCPLEQSVEFEAVEWESKPPLADPKQLLMPNIASNGEPLPLPAPMDERGSFPVEVANLDQLAQELIERAALQRQTDTHPGMLTLLNQLFSPKDEGI